MTDILICKFDLNFSSCIRTGACIRPGNPNDGVNSFVISMAGSATSTGGSGPSNPPKILLAKPGLVPGTPVAGKFGRGGTGDEYTTSLRSRLPSSIGSLNLLSDSWDFHIDRFLPVTNQFHKHSLIFCSLFLLLVFLE